MESLRDIVSVTCGHAHTCCLEASGDVYSFGWNKYGQLGTGNWEGEAYPVLAKLSRDAPIPLEVSLPSPHHLTIIFLDLYPHWEPHLLDLLAPGLRRLGPHYHRDAQR